MTADTISSPDEISIGAFRPSPAFRFEPHCDWIFYAGLRGSGIGVLRRTSSNTAYRIIFMLAPKSKADGVPKYSRSPRCSPSRDVIIPMRSSFSWTSTAASAATFPGSWRHGGCRVTHQGTGGRPRLCGEAQLPRHRRHADPGWSRIHRRLGIGVPGPRNGNGIGFGSDNRT